MSVPFAARLQSEPDCPHVGELSFSLLEAALSLAAAGGVAVVGLRGSADCKIYVLLGLAERGGGRVIGRSSEEVL